MARGIVYREGVAEGLLCWTEWIEKLDRDILEVPQVSGGQRESMNASCGGDHHIFQDIARPPQHQTRPVSEAEDIHRENCVREGKVLDP
jgi:hypothetical protein